MSREHERVCAGTAIPCKNDGFESLLRFNLSSSPENLLFELLVDDVEVPDRVHVTLHVSDVWVLECTTQMEESVTSMWKNMMKKNVN